MKNIRRFVLDSLEDEMYKIRLDEIMYLQVFCYNPYTYEIEDMLNVHTIREALENES